MIAMHHDRHINSPHHTGDELRIPTLGQTSQLCPPKYTDDHNCRRRIGEDQCRQIPSQMVRTKLQAPIPWMQ